MGEGVDGVCLGDGEVRLGEDEGVGGSGCGWVVFR